MTFKTSRIATSLAAMAAFSMAASPALAHGRWDHRHHRGGGDGGDVLAGLLVVGGIAAIAVAASNADKRDETRGHAEPDRPAPYPGGPEYGRPAPDWHDGDAGPYADRAPDTGDDEAGGYDRGGEPDEEGAPPPDEAADVGPRGGSFDQAVDACRDDMERGERRVVSIDSVRRMGGRYSVEGSLEDGRGFACSVDDGGQVRSSSVGGAGRA